MPLPSALQPLRHPVFRLIWLANLCANTGMWMQNTGAGWLMTSLAPSPVMVSMVQVASLLPVFFLALPAGTLADLVDRRLYLIAAQAWIAACGLLLAILTALGVLGPWGLLALTAAIGAGTAANFPAWAATVPETVPRQDLPQAIVLNGIGFNLTRAVGPALGGFTVAAAGAEATFALNALCFLIVVVALFRWKREVPRPRGPREHFFSALRTGIGYVRASPLLQATILRGCVFFGCLAAIWGLLPLLVREQLGLGPEWYGAMLGAIGVGAVSGGFILPSIRARFQRGSTVVGACIAGGAALALLGQASHWALALPALMVFGFAWIAGASTLQASAQMATASWVRARAIGIYHLATFGSLAVGSALGGWAGDALGLPLALAAAGACCATGAVLVRHLRIEPQPQPPAAPPPEAMPQAEPAAASLESILHAEQSGRVLESVRYEIAPGDRAAFIAAMQECRQVRLRNGAIVWRLYEDVAHPERWVELWVMENWTDHLRETGRLTPWDQAVLARAASFHQGPKLPELSRFINVR